jgi:hypothetical protein
MDDMPFFKSRAARAWIAVALGVVGLGATALAAAPVGARAPACQRPPECGPDGWLYKRVPSLFAAEKFRTACDAHVACYGALRASKHECDQRFYADTFVACAAVFPQHDKNVTEMAGFASCGRVAALYRRAVDLQGDEAYNAAQLCAEEAATRTAQEEPPPIVTQDPPLIALGRSTQITIRAVDAATGAPLDGAVTIDGVAVGRTNTAFRYTPRISFEAWGWHRHMRDAVGTVAVAGHASASFVVARARPALTVGLTPTLDHLAPGSVAMTVSAVDAITQGDIDGTVTMAGTTVGHTNMAFSVLVPSSRSTKWCPDLWVVADGYPDTPAGGNDCL